MTEHDLGQRGQAPLQRRFYFEFVLIFLVVSLGVVGAYPIGFYKFRLVDLVLMIAPLYYFNLMLRGLLERRAVLLVLLYAISIVVRIFYELSSAFTVETTRTLFGMAATYLAPSILFISRESAITRRVAIGLLVAGWIVSLLSQMGLLVYGESLVSGAVDLARVLGIERRDGKFVLDYGETTITIWRAFSVGVTFALILARTHLSTKILGLLGLVLQYAGGGGGRSPVLFIFFLPIILYSWQGSLSRFARVRKLLFAGFIGVAMTGMYLWSPIGGADPVKSGGSHFERATEVFLLFEKDGWDLAAEGGGFEMRTVVYQQYIDGILSDPAVFFFGTGLRKGGAFDYTVLSGLAHNLILDVWGLSGLVGLIFMLSFLGYVILDMKSLLKAAPTSGVDQILAYSYAGAILFMIQYMMVQPTTADRSFMIVFYFAGGLLKPLERCIREGRNASMSTAT